MTDSKDSEATPDNLENALELAFRRGHPGADAPQRLASVLLALEERAGPVPRLHLHLPAAEQDPVLKVDHDHEFSSRYQIVGEIGQGGVGTVYKGRDADLGRDVAVKVLHDRYRDNGEVLQRFVEEAQIGGQLQHPGIVPVYELGLQADDRPFIAMKLVKGQTLETQLERRRDPAEDRRRFLGIFEQVCQTVAYAHARGVVHRDLKPSNVMIGSFGEVQVVDWGFAKVLQRSSAADDARASRGRTEESVVDTVRSQEGSSHSTAGSVMGTVWYMPPEQARGQVQDMDERSDVFSLGATLCEILTGSPPYTQEDGDDLLEQAAAACLEPAKARLAACGAERELIRIAKHCLSPNRSMRPRDAGVVAEKVAAFLQSVEERARAAEVEAAEARVRAEDARKARRLTLALAASLLATAFLAGSGYLWVDGLREAEQRRGAARVHAALAAARRLQGQAEGAGSTAVSEWEDAWKAANDAVALARTESVTDGLAEEASAFEEVLRREHERVVQAARQTAREQRLLRTLTEIRIPTDDDRVLEGWVVPRDANGLDAEYREAFAQYGTDLDSLGPDEAAKAFGGKIASEVAAALDHWALVRRKASGKDDASWPRLLETAGHLDSDPWRERLRGQLLSTQLDLQALRELASSADFESLTAVSLGLLGQALREAGDGATALSVFAAGERIYPLDFALNLSLGLALERADPPLWREAAARYKVAHALQPRLGRVLFRLGYVLYKAGDLEAAVSAYRQSIRINPEQAGAHINLGHAFLEQGELDESIEHSQIAIQLKPDQALAHNNLGRALDKKGETEEAIKHLREAIRLKPDLHYPHTNLGKALKEKGELEEAIKHFRQALRLKKDSADAHTNLGSALEMKGELDKAIELHRKALRLEPDSADSHAHAHAHSNLGLALEKKGQPEEALQHHREAIRLEPECAMARRNFGALLGNQGKWDDATRHYQVAIRLEPDSAKAHMNLGVVLARTGELNKAIEHSRTATRLASDDARAHHGLGIVLAMRGEMDEAITRFRRATLLKPDYAKAHGNLGRALKNQGKLDEAIEHLRAAIRLQPGNVPAHILLGNVLAKKGESEEAIELYRKATQLNPDSAIARRNLAIAHYNLGGELRQRGDVTGAIQNMRVAIGLDDALASAYSSLGGLLSDKGDFEGAARCFAKALELDPESSLVHHNLGTLAARRGQMRQAMKHWQDATRRKPVCGDAHKELALQLRREGKHEEAIKHLELAVEHGTSEPHKTKSNLGFYLLDRDLPRAIELFKAAVKAKKDDPLFHHNLGAALLRKGDVADAIRCWQDAIRLDPAYADAYRALGVVFLEQKKLEDSIEKFQTAAGLYAEQDTATARTQEAFARRQIQQIRGAMDVLSRRRTAASPEEWARAVRLGSGRHGEIVALTEATLRSAPELVELPVDRKSAWGIYNSACAAALLAGNIANGLTAAERIRVRGLARAWLAREVGRWRGVLSGGVAPAAQARHRLAHSLKDEDFASVRGAALEGLSKDERDAWQRLWTEIERAAKQVGR